MKQYFDFSHFRGDLFGGITAGIVALPLALAFGVSSGLGPSAGLYGAIFVSFFAALFGGTNTQISGPTAPMTAVTMVLVGTIIASKDGNIEAALPIILIVFLMSGLFQIGLGLMGIGKYIKFIPYPVVSGFMTAIGVIILITQILPVLGYYPKEDQALVDTFKPQAEEVILDKILKDEAGEGLLVLEDFEETIERAHLISEEEIQKESETLAGKYSSGVLGTLKVLPKAVKSISWIEVCLAFITILIIYGFKRITTAVPSTLIALVVMTGATIGFGLDYRPVTEIPSGLPLPHFEMFTQFDFGSISPYIFTAITLAFLGAIDSLLTSVVADNMTRTSHNPNKELVGQGIGNSIGAFFGGIPGAGATIRTVVNINAGGKTKLSGMTAGILLLIILLALGPIASKIPAAVLAGILVTVGIGVIDYKGLRSIKVMPRTEVVILFVVLILSSVWNLVYAVAIGLVLAALMFMERIGNMTTENSESEVLESDGVWDNPEAASKLMEKVIVKHISGPLFFGSASEFNKLIRQIPATAEIIVFRVGKMSYMDQSGLVTMEENVRNLDSQNKKILFVKLQKQPRSMMMHVKLIPNVVPENQIFDSMEKCVVWVRAYLESQ